MQQYCSDITWSVPSRCKPPKIVMQITVCDVSDQDNINIIVTGTTAQAGPMKHTGMLLSDICACASDAWVILAW